MSWEKFVQMETFEMIEHPKPDNGKDPKTPDLQDVEPGSDADETPVPEVGKTPPDPTNRK